MEKGHAKLNACPFLQNNVFIFFCLHFSGLFRCDSFYFFITPDEIAAVRIADFSGNKRNIVTGKKGSMFSAALILVAVIYSLQVIL